MVSPDEQDRLVAEEGWFSLYDFPDEMMPGADDCCSVEVMLCDGSVIQASRHWHYPSYNDPCRWEDWFSSDPCVWDTKNGRLSGQQEPILWRPFAGDAELRDAAARYVAKKRAERDEERRERELRETARSFNKGWFAPAGKDGRDA